MILKFFIELVKVIGGLAAIYLAASIFSFIGHQPMFMIIPLLIVTALVLWNEVRA